MPTFKVTVESTKTTVLTVHADNMRFAIDSAMEKVRKGKKSEALALKHTIILEQADEKLMFSKVVCEPIELWPT